MYLLELLNFHKTVPSQLQKTRKPPTPKLTIFEARYSMPRATWYANEMQSLCVSGRRSQRATGCSYPAAAIVCGGRRSRRKSRRFPCGANSTMTYSGPGGWEWEVNDLLNDCLID